MTTTTPKAGTAPAIVALLRGILIAVAIGALTALVAAITGADLSSIPAEWRPVAAALLIVAVRFLEGLVDQLRGQAPQANALGSRPSSATAYINTTAGGPIDAGRLPYSTASGIVGADLTTEELETVLGLAARKLEQRNAAPTAAPATAAEPTY